ncbi:MAG: translation elongation factor Ts [Chitinivibrionia bacterium]|nr:translation elongation factor Ts [Chitinivibrionia bacterium]
MEISATLVKDLRGRTGAGFMDCKRALEECGGDMDKAMEFLRLKGLAKAQKKSGRATGEGLVVSYIHPGNRIGVLLEVNCETDFAAKTEDFQLFAKHIAMQIAASAPLAVGREDLEPEAIEKEREFLKKQVMEEKKPDHVMEKIIAGRMEKFFSENCLVDQTYIRDNDKKVGDLLTELIAKIGENVRIARFARFQLGQ